MKDKISITKKDILKITVLAVIFMIFFFTGFFLNRSISNDVIMSNSSSAIDVWQTIGIWVGSLGTVAAIVFVVINTNRQIKNQNKESHRPYLSVKEYIDPEEKDLHSIINLKVQQDNSTICQLPNKLKYIKLKNVGYGLATKAKIVPLNYSIQHNNYITSELSDDLSRKHLINCIEEEDTIKLRLGFHIYQNELKRMFTISFLIFYSDLNDNSYSILAQFDKIQDKFTVVNFFHDNTKAFRDKINKLEINYEKIKNTYEADN